MNLEVKASDGNADSSPQWKNPAEVMKMRKRKKGNSARLGAKEVVPKPYNEHQPSAKTNGSSLKRRNPFSLSDSISNKRLNTSDGGMRPIAAPVDTKLFSVLDQDQNSETQENNHTLKSVSKSLLQQDNICKSTNVTTSSSCELPKGSKDKLQKENKDFPCDWSLRLKMRFLSPGSFAWCGALKSSEEASGLVNFTCCDHDRALKIKDGTTPGSQFQEACMYWIHPNFPWLRMFPRIMGDVKISNINGFTVDENVRKHMLADWTDSFTSVFQLLRAKLCPYFYLCTHQFSVLFHASGVGGSSEMDAILTPTTRGLREAMQTEGIEFTLPLKAARQSDGSQVPGSQSDKQSEEKGIEIQTNCDDGAINSPTAAAGDEATEENIEEEIGDTDSGAQTWLESLGVDKTKFPELEATKVKLQREGFRAIDNRPESTVYVVGSEAQALYNFLLNCKSCIANTGAQMGIPPTILSPVAFKGATLKSLKVHHGKVRQQDSDGSNITSNMVEVVGPILPHTIFKLCRLFETTQNGQFSAVCHVHEPTVPFNNTKNDHKNDTFFSEICNKVDVEHFLKDGKDRQEKQAIREIVCDNSFYSWTRS